ncbi:hypothetical protein KZW06_29210, partial [Klebsiella pneumoniae]|nr:hypothetical protein [Klebsiella pneumoniae]
RNKYRTRLDSAPNGGTYVFISQKGMREAITGSNNDSSKWEAKPNDPALETEYLKRLMAVLAQNEQRAKNGEPPIANIKDNTVPAAKDKKADDASSKAAAAIAAQNVSRTSAQGNDAADAAVPSEVTLGEP